MLTYMIHLGYLGYNQKLKTAFVPNEEIRQELTTAVESKPWNELLKFRQDSENLLDSTLDMDGVAVAVQIEKSITSMLLLFSITMKIHLAVYSQSHI